MSSKKQVSTVLQGINSLIYDATLGVTEIVEETHNQVIHPPFLPSTPIQHLISSIAGLSYANIKTSSRFINKITDQLLKNLSPILGELKRSDNQEKLQATLNGVVGDYLKKSKNALAIPMQFRVQNNTIPLTAKGIEESYSNLNGEILIMVHGSCLNDAQWTRKNHNHGEELAKNLNKTLIYLYYNSGQHVSTNGKEFNNKIEELITNWPVPVKEIIIVSHSMGGLVSRSAVHYGQQKPTNWTKLLKKIVFLGTPHHGAPLENAGNYFETILGVLPYTKPFARLGKIRSAGVTDLRYGNIIDDDWKNYNRFKLTGDKRLNVPLPKSIISYAIAASLSKETDSSRLKGDSLVNIDSALGKHRTESKILNFNYSWITYETNHMDLLSKPEVYDKLKDWLID